MIQKCEVCGDPPEHLRCHAINCPVDVYSDALDRATAVAGISERSASLAIASFLAYLEAHVPDHLDEVEWVRSEWVEMRHRKNLASQK